MKYRNKKPLQSLECKETDRTDQTTPFLFFYFSFCLVIMLTVIYYKVTRAFGIRASKVVFTGRLRSLSYQAIRAVDLRKNGKVAGSVRIISASSTRGGPHDSYLR